MLQCQEDRNFKLIENRKEIQSQVNNEKRQKFSIDSLQRNTINYFLKDNIFKSISEEKIKEGSYNEEDFDIINYNSEIADDQIIINQNDDEFNDNFLFSKPENEINEITELNNNQSDNNKTKTIDSLSNIESKKDIKSNKNNEPKKNIKSKNNIKFNNSSDSKKNIESIQKNIRNCLCEIINKDENNKISENKQKNENNDINIPKLNKLIYTKKNAINTSKGKNIKRKIMQKDKEEDSKNNSFNIKTIINEKEFPVLSTNNKDDINKNETNNNNESSNNDFLSKKNKNEETNIETTILNNIDKINKTEIINEIVDEDENEKIIEKKEKYFNNDNENNIEENNKNENNISNNNENENNSNKNNAQINSNNNVNMKEDNKEEKKNLHEETAEKTGRDSVKCNNTKFNNNTYLNETTEKENLYLDTANNNSIINNNKNYEKLYSEQSLLTNYSQIHYNTECNENNIKIINKLKEMQNYLKLKPKKTVKKVNYKINISPKLKSINCMNNKQIKNNIPSYRREQILLTESKLLNQPRTSIKSENRKTHAAKFSMASIFSNENSTSKSIISLIRGTLGRSYHKKSSYLALLYEDNNKKNNTYKFYLENKCNTKSCFNNSSLLNYSKLSIYSYSHRYKKNFKKKAKKIDYLKYAKTIKEQNSIINEKSEKLLSQQYRDVIEYELPNNNKTLISEEVKNFNINNKIILNYSKLEKFSAKLILFDGKIYKLVMKSNNEECKIVQRYFTLTKNCFKYYNNFEEAKEKNENPLVQFDIRYVRKCEILDIKKYEKFLVNKDVQIKYIFCIYLTQNNDNFVFGFENAKYGESIFNILNILKNYYDDMAVKLNK